MRHTTIFVALGLVDGLRPPSIITRSTQTRRRSAVDLEEEARIRAQLEAHAEGQHGKNFKKHLSPAAKRRRAKRGASFEAAQEIGRDLAAQLRDTKTLDETARDLLEELVSTTSGARGWFVSLLTDEDLASLFETPIDDALLLPIAARPEPNLRLCVMNVAMSSATAIAHERDGHHDLARASRSTAKRSAALCSALLERDLMLGLPEALRALYDAVAPRDDLGELGAVLGLSSDLPVIDDEWSQFLDKWGYGPDQRAAIRQMLHENWAPVVREG